MDKLTQEWFTNHCPECDEYRIDSDTCMRVDKIVMSMKSCPKEKSLLNMAILHQQGSRYKAIIDRTNKLLNEVK